MTKILGVVPNLPYTNFESTNVRGYPAIHGVIETNTGKTLCGKNPENWDIANYHQINCKICMRYLLEKYGPEWKDKI